MRCLSLRVWHVGHRVACVVVPQSRQGFGMVGRLLGMDDTPVVDEPVKTDAPSFGTLPFLLSLNAVFTFMCLMQLLKIADAVT